MTYLTPRQREVYHHILKNGWNENTWKELGFVHRESIYPSLNILLANGYLREQAKYKAVRKGIYVK